MNGALLQSIESAGVEEAHSNVTGVVCWIPAAHMEHQA